LNHHWILFLFILPCRSGCYPYLQKFNVKDSYLRL
jgi:hypothetical protein